MYNQHRQRVPPQQEAAARQRRNRLSLRRYPTPYSAKNLRDNSEVAVKVIDLKSIDNEVTRYLLNMEKIAAMSCDNPHVLRGIKVLQNSLNCFIVTELCNGGTLKNLIKTVGPLGEERSLKFLK